MIKFSQKGYTLVKIIIVVAIIAVILSILLPNYIKMGGTSAKDICINNLKQIDSAMERWALDNNIPAGTVPGGAEEEEIYAYINGAKPKCPRSGGYEMHATGANPQVTCLRGDEGHALPD